MMLTTLADVARRTGRKVVEVDGWRSRTRPGGMTAVRTIVCHHTGSPGTGEISLALLRDGRPDLNGPLSQFGLGRSGTIYVIAAGRCNHAGVVLDQSYANGNAIGIEAMNDGVSEPWGDAILITYRLLCRELMREFGLNITRVLGHKEVCDPVGRKSDPDFSMPAFRASITALDAAPPTPPAPPAHTEVDVFTASDFGDTLWVIDGINRKKISDPAVAHALNEAGVPNIGRVASNVLGAFPAVVDTDTIVNTARDQVIAAIRTAPAGATAEQIADVIANRLAN